MVKRIRENTLGIKTFYTIVGMLVNAIIGTGAVLYNINIHDKMDRFLVSGIAFCSAGLFFCFIHDVVKARTLNVEV